MIRLSCSSVCLRGWPLEDALAVHERIGYRRAEVIALGGAWGVDLAEWDAQRLGDALSRHGQELSALYVRPVDVRSAEAFAESLGYVRRGIDTAAALGCTRVVFPPLRPREGYDYARLAEGCRALADHIGRRDVVLALENHHEWPLSYTEDFARLFALVDDPRVGITMDTGHFTSSGVDMVDFVGRFPGRIKHLHLKDHIGTQSVALGRGETDNAAVLERLRAAGYDGCASVELEVRDRENTQRYLTEAFAYCRDVLGLE
jgi:sugar phosphate isomerase/epimerase